MTSRHRSLWPREHGAYAQLTAPLLAARIRSRLQDEVETRPQSTAGWLAALRASSVAMAGDAARRLPKSRNLRIRPWHSIHIHDVDVRCYASAELNEHYVQT